MKTLHIYDRKDYTDEMTMFEKYSVRGIIRRNGRIAMQKGAKGDYKILGGGVDEGEEFAQALVREVKEESGLLVIPESIEEIGEIIEKRADLFESDKIFICHSCFYYCSIRSEQVEPQMTPSEIEKGYKLVWATPQTIIEANQPFLSEPWIYRDTEFVREFLLSERG